MSEEFKNSYRSDDRDFTRNYLITFPILIVFILNLVRRSLQVELNNFSKIVSLPFISKQTFSSARKKLLPEAFVGLNRMLINEFYTDNTIPKFMDFRLIVVDGSTLQLPESPSIKKKYGACGNQHKLDEMSMARISYAYDPLSGLTLDAIMRPYTTAERPMAFDHILNIHPLNDSEDLYLFDRGYPSITLIFFLVYNHKNFVMRCNTSWLSEVQEVFKSGKKDAIIEIHPRMLKGEKRKDFQKKLPEICLKTRIKIRILIIELCTGEKEILITSLLDKVRFEYSIFKDLYHCRWGVEENYKFQKVRIEIENFSGESTNAIEQDFHASVFTANVRALIAGEAQRELEKEYPKRELQYEYKINQNIALGILKDEIVMALFDPEIDLKGFCEGIKQSMKKSTVPIRPGRSYKRKWKFVRKYSMNQRRSL